MPFPLENLSLPPREHKKVNYAEFENFSDSSSESNKKQNHGNYISWTSNEDAILIEQVQKFMESQNQASISPNNEIINNNSRSNDVNQKSDNNEIDLNLNKEKILIENENKTHSENLGENNINTQCDKGKRLNNPINNINWSKIAEKLEKKNARQCQTRWQNILDPNRVKGPWTKEEDMKLLELINKFGPEKWSNISTYLPGRLGKQCRERWFNHLNPEIRKASWSKEEEWALFLLHRKYGNSWSTFSEKIPGRTDNTIKNHWNSIMKKNIVGINNQYQEMIKGKTKEEIEEIEKNIMDKCNDVMQKEYNKYYQDKLKAFPNMTLNKRIKKEKEKEKENIQRENNINNNSKENSSDNILNQIKLKTPTKNKKKIFEHIKINEKETKKGNKIKKTMNEKKEDVKEKKPKSKEHKKQNISKRRNKYFNINDEKELKIIKSGEKVLQKDKNLLIEEAEMKYKEKQKLKSEKRSASVHNKNENEMEEEEEENKNLKKLNSLSNKNTAKKGKKTNNKNIKLKNKKTKFNVAKLSNFKEKDFQNNNNLNNPKLNYNNNFMNNSYYSTKIMSNINNDYMSSNNANMPYPVYLMEKYPYYLDEEKDFSKINSNKILISDSKDINKFKKEQPFPFKIPPTGPFYRSDIKNSSESSGGNNSMGKITPDFRMNPPFIPSNDKYHPFTIPQNLQNRSAFNSNPKIIRYAPGIDNNNNNKISTDSNSIRSYTYNQSILSANSAFKKSSSGSGSGSRKSFQPTVGSFNFNNMADLNKEYFSNIVLDDKNANNKI